MFSYGQMWSQVQKLLELPQRPLVGLHKYFLVTKHGAHDEATRGGVTPLFPLLGGCVSPGVMVFSVEGCGRPRNISPFCPKPFQSPSALGHVLCPFNMFQGMKVHLGLRISWPPIQ